MTSATIEAIPSPCRESAILPQPIQRPAFGVPPAIDYADQPHDDLLCSSEARILIVDDDEAVCKIVESALARPGFVIDMVSRPAQLETQLRAQTYHVIVLDYILPSLESEQVLGWLRDYQPQASIIVVTGFPSVEGALQCLRARTFDYLTKPFQVAHLQKLVHRALESKGLLRLSESALRESLGQVIRERRKGLGLTLAQMAQRTNVSLGYLSQIELGKNSASIETLYRISMGLGIRMSELFQSIQIQG